MRELEKMAPLLSYCAGSWKADMVLGSVLQDDRLSEPLPSPAPSHRAASRSATPSVAPPPRSASRRGSHRSHTALSRASTPSGAPTSRASQMSPPTGPTSSALQQPPSPSVRKAGGSKAKRKRELSPVPHDGKKAKSTENVSSSGAKTGFFFFSFLFLFLFFRLCAKLSGVGKRSCVEPRPAFLAFVASGAGPVQGRASSAPPSPTGKGKGKAREKTPDDDDDDDGDHSPPESDPLANFSGSQRKYAALQAERASGSKEATVSAIFSFISACSFFSGFGQ